MARGVATYLNKSLGYFHNGNNGQSVPPSVLNLPNNPMMYGTNEYGTIQTTVVARSGSDDFPRIGPMTLASNGCLYGVHTGFTTAIDSPIGSSNFLQKLDPATGITTMIPMNNNRGAYGGIVRASNEKLYTIPFRNNSSTNAALPIYEIDPSNDSVTLIKDITLPAERGYLGGVLAPNGLIYCAPYDGSAGANSGNILIINPFTKTLSSLNTGIGTINGYVAAVLAPNGKIYILPFNSPFIIVIEPMNGNNVYSINFQRVLQRNTIAAGFWGGVLALDNKIYCISYGQNFILQINPENDSVTAIYNKGFLDTRNPMFYPSANRVNRDSANLGGGFPTLGTNGKIYFVQITFESPNSTITDRNTSRLLLPYEFDPETQTISKLYGSEGLDWNTITNIPSSPTMGGFIFQGSCLSQTGDIWISPHAIRNNQNNKLYLKLTGFPPATPDMYTMPPLDQLQYSLYNKYINKF
jgi:hypothetical protein